jgi:hypothetical protein
MGLNVQFNFLNSQIGTKLYAHGYNGTISNRYETKQTILSNNNDDTEREKESIVYIISLLF